MHPFEREFHFKTNKPPSVLVCKLRRIDCLMHLSVPDSIPSSATSDGTTSKKFGSSLAITWKKGRLINGGSTCQPLGLHFLPFYHCSSSFLSIAFSAGVTTTRFENPRRKYADITGEDLITKLCGHTWLVVSHSKTWRTKMEYDYDLVLYCNTRKARDEPPLVLPVGLADDTYDLSVGPFSFTSQTILNRPPSPC